MGTRHPMLYHRSLIVRSDRMNWIAGSPPAGILDQLSALQRDSQSMESRGVDMPHNIDLPTVSSSSNCNNDSSSCSDGSSSSSSSSRSNISHLVSESNTVDSPIGFRCGFKARYLQAIEQCTITVRLLPFDRTSSPVAAGSSTPIMSTESANTSTSHATLDIINTAPDPRPHLNYELVVTFDQPHRAVTPGQILALYAGDECLGGGVISLSDMP